MKSLGPIHEPDDQRDEERNAPDWPVTVAIEADGDRGYFVIPASVLERWRSSAAAR